MKLAKTTDKRNANLFMNTISITQNITINYNRNQNNGFVYDILFLKKIIEKV